jgi:outer membrane protein
MKKIILFSIYCLLWSLTGNAQRIALIDMEYILENIPAYQKANYELEQLSQQYQKAIEAKSQEA